MSEIKKLGRYQIIAEIGRGGMGQVYKAHDPKLNRTIALKIMGQSQERFATQRFLREAETTARLRHPNIITVYDFGQEKEQYYFTMDFIAGITLHELLNKPIATTRTVDILIKVGKALHYAHSEGIIHRDLKPANIMLDENREPKIMDFGLAKVLSAANKLSQTGVIMGTLQYMPPEQAQGRQREIDARTDVYSLGAIFYEMLTARPPFSGTETNFLIYQILHKKPVPPRKIKPHIPRDLEYICLKALEKKKHRRYQSVIELVEDLERFSNKEPVRSYRSKINKKVVILCAVILTLFTGILLFYKPTPPKKTSSKKAVIAKKQELVEILNPIKLQNNKYMEVDFTTTSIKLQARIEKAKTRQILVNDNKIKWDEQGVFSQEIVLKIKKNKIVLVILHQDGKYIERRWTVFRQPRIITLPKSRKLVMFCGNAQHTGVYKSQGVRQLTGHKWLFKTEKKIWSSPVVVDGTVYFGCDDGYLYAVDSKSGLLIWKFKTGDSISSSPAILDGVVYFGSNDSYIYAVNSATGKEKWKFKTGNLVESSPVIAGEILYCGSGDYHLYALDIHSGNLLWKRKTLNKVTSSPIINGELVGCGSWDGFFYFFNRITGKHKWLFPTIPRNCIYGSGSIYENTVYFGDLQGALYAYSLIAGKKLWQVKIGNRIVASPAVTANTIYSGSSNGLYVLSRATGQLKWKVSTQQRIETSPAIAQGVIYFGCWDYNFYALSITRKKLWRYKTGCYMTSSPFVKDGAIYFGGYNGYLYCLH